MVNYGRLLLHLPLFSVVFYGIVWDLCNITVGWQTYGGKFKFLTFWDQIIQTLYFGLCVVNDITSDGESSRMKRVIDRFLVSVAFPMGVFVVITFWAIYYVDRELVFPRSLDGIIPPWLNHVMHTVPLPFLLLDKFFIHHHYPSRRKGMFLTLVFASIYQVWILWIAYRADIWVYPVLQVLNVAQKCVFFLILWAFLISIYLLGDGLTRFWWRHEIAQANRGKKRQ